MGFQLVRAEDKEIAVWNVDHGHIFVFQIPEQGRHLIPEPFREVPDATRNAASLEAEALAFATADSRSRRLID